LKSEREEKSTEIYRKEFEEKKSTEKSTLFPL
jgi:hypothetical protein